MLRRSVLLLAVVCVVGLGVMAGPALAGTVLGQTVTSGDVCASGWVGFIPSGSVSYTVPAGGGTITSWSTLAGSTGGTQLAFVVGRPTGTPDQYKIIAISDTETLTPNVINTFPVSIAVQGGDVIGAWVVNDGWVCDYPTGNSADQLDYLFTTPTVGSTIDFDVSSEYLLNISATFNGGGVAIPQVNNVFLCYSRFEQDGGAVFNVNQEDALVKAGYWVPDAVAGNVVGGDNIGAYHLVCNPPSGLSQTNQFLDDGGNVIAASLLGADSTDGLYPILG